jgi:magnesium transporter
MDQEDVSYIFTEYNLTSAPVVNKAGRLIGVVSVGDMMEVIEEEAEEDILRLGGLRGLIDIHTDIASTARHRLPWLLINLMLSTLTCLVIQHFEGTIASMALLAAIMPLVASLAGNAGTQTLTVVVRALATKEIESSNSVRVVTKEILAAAINGLGCGVMAGLAVYAWQGSVLLSVILGMALFLNFLVAGLVGASVPMVLKRLGTDPAVASGVFLTTITDVVGFFVFLSLAGFLLL